MSTAHQWWTGVDKYILCQRVVLTHSRLARCTGTPWYGLNFPNWLELLKLKSSQVERRQATRPISEGINKNLFSDLFLMNGRIGGIGVPGK